MCGVQKLLLEFMRAIGLRAFLGHHPWSHWKSKPSGSASQSGCHIAQAFRIPKSLVWSPISLWSYKPTVADKLAYPQNISYMFSSSFSVYAILSTHLHTYTLPSRPLFTYYNSIQYLRSSSKSLSLLLCEIFGVTYIITNYPFQIIYWGH